MYRDNYISSLRSELLETVEEHLSPLAMRYRYSDVPLEANVKWRPLVLVIGNYSSGKSTLINELVGAKVQSTGQAPTDDSFTIITYDHDQPNGRDTQVTEERDGRFLLNDPEYPFETLKKHGDRFASHFSLKKVNSPFLKNLALIDTPGMLDSVAERDRGYDYQEVVGDLAQIADLVLVLFDPHKAGTVREAHTSLRDVLPSKTFEDRVLFVLNRIDECASLTDLLQVYGTLCWNLSQMTGRKDIPKIRLTYSPAAMDKHGLEDDVKPEFLSYLENQRSELKDAILEAPRHRLDHLASFIETHSTRLSHYLEALISYRKRFRLFNFKYFMFSLFISAVTGGLGSFLMILNEMFTDMNPEFFIYIAGGIGAGTLALCMTILRRLFTSMFHRKNLKKLEELTPIENQSRRDSWNSVKGHVLNYLKRTGGRYSLANLKHDYRNIKYVRDSGTREIREALNELSALKPDLPSDEEKEPSNILQFIRKEGEQNQL